jgi:hypothetical protein
MVNMEGEKQKKYSEPPPMSRKNQRCPSTALHIPYPPRRTSPLCNGGGEQGGFTVALPKNDTASCLSPPKKNHHLCNGGGGRGCSLWRCTSMALHVAYYPPPPPPPHHPHPGIYKN